MEYEKVTNEIKNENFKSFAYANLVLETFSRNSILKEDHWPAELEKSNQRMKEILETRMEDLEFKMTELEDLKYEKDIELETQSTMIYKLFETIDHKFLKLDYLDLKSQNLELEDITYFIKVLDHEVLDFENMIQERISIRDILSHLKPNPRKEAV